MFRDSSSFSMPNNSPSENRAQRRMASQLKTNLSNFFSLEKPKNIPHQFLRYVITGGLSAGLDFSLLVFFVEILSLHYLIASGLSFVAAVLLNYSISRVWVFTRGRFSPPIELIGFIAVNVIGLGFNQLLMWFFVGSLSVDYRVTKGISIVVVTLWNFLTKKYIIFKG